MACNLPISDRRSDWERTLRTAGRENTDWGSILGNGGNGICTPIFLPVARAFGIDPLHFGVILILNGGIGLITPPVGTVLFVGSAVAKLPIGVVTKAAMPFFFALFIVLLFVTYVPGLSLWLPRALGL